MKEFKPCPFCGQQQDDHQMLVFESCDTDGYYVKCDSCGACGPVGYPDEYDAYDYDACDRAAEDAQEKAASLWGEVCMTKDALHAELDAALAEKAESDASKVSTEKAEADRDVLRHALDESLKLQSHYAELLNMYDGGNRIQFANSDEWLNRLRKIDRLQAEEEEA